MSLTFRRKIWTRVLQEHPETQTTQKQVYALWAHLNESVWRLDEDQVKSATAVLKRHEDAEVELIPVTPEEGIAALAFAFTEVLDGYGEEIHEVAMDSTCEYAMLCYNESYSNSRCRENKCARLRVVWDCGRSQGPSAAVSVHLHGIK